MAAEQTRGTAYITYIPYIYAYIYTYIYVSFFFRETSSQSKIVSKEKLEEVV